jgi:hypothetical protein
LSNPGQPGHRSIAEADLDRDLQSHEIAKQVRLRLEPIAKRYGARIKVAEVPPGSRGHVARAGAPTAARRRSRSLAEKEPSHRLPGADMCHAGVSMRDPEIIETELMEISAIADDSIKLERIIAWCASYPDEVPFALHQLMGRIDMHQSRTSKT